ncbi:ABC transporter permease [Nakamurella flavida]|uniref:ABC transporter permease n=1 Tax=Nakamurella flavida TaxID=363630 RepID=A0A939C3D1_9ACTN|nr:ABC transporter permease [Nakamurella flavida]MBM9476941.1 ABC transporter permease [Nakamurella flavida]MDP9779886.1 peptide/nickel transport system permease protein [Nakamurella flavida]
MGDEHVPARNVPATELEYLTLEATDTDVGRAGGGSGTVTPVAAKTEFRLVLSRFLRHRAALAGLVVLALIVLLAFTSIGWGPIPGWWKYDYTDFATQLTDGGAPTLSLWPPSLGEHPFGQSNEGRDYFALVMRGLQQSLIIAFLVGITSTILGTVIGAVAGYFRGWAEGVLMRITDVIITIPLLAIAAVVANSVGGGGILFLGLLLGLFTWTGLARIVRGEFLSLREKEFVDAARSVGASSGRIIFRHILPNTIGVITVSATLSISGAILLESALSFLNLGVKSPDTSLGLLLQQYRQAMDVRPYLFWWPGVLIVLISLAINFIGDGLRDAFDPRQNRAKA